MGKLPLREKSVSLCFFEEQQLFIPEPMQHDLRSTRKAEKAVDDLTGILCLLIHVT